MMDQTQNPYASPEEVEDGSGLDADTLLMILRRGIAWLQWGALGWLIGTLYVGAVGALTVFPVRMDTKQIQEDVGIFFGCVCMAIIFLAFLSLFPATWLCLRGTAGEEYRPGRRCLLVSGLTGLGGLLIYWTIILAPVSVILWMISFWQWSRFLKFVCWKIDLPDVAHRTRIMALIPLAWFLLAGIALALMYLNPFTETPVLWLVMIGIMVALTTVYFGLEIWALGKILAGIAKLLENEE